MRSLDLFWKTNRDWWKYCNGIPVLKENAPSEAHQIYQNYIIQTAALHVVDSWKIGEYTVLTLEDEIPTYEHNKYRINSVLYDIVPTYDMGNKCIAIKTDEEDLGHRLVEFVLIEGDV